jgi:hypothetical protein
MRLRRQNKSGYVYKKKGGGSKPHPKAFLEQPCGKENLHFEDFVQKSFYFFMFPMFYMPNTTNLLKKKPLV